MSEKIKLSKRTLFDIIDALPNGSTISSVDKEYISGSTHYGGYNDFSKLNDNEYYETIHIYYGCSIIDVIEDLAVEAQDEDGDPHDGIVITDNSGKIIHEWLPGTIEIDIDENIDDLKQRVAKRYINYALFDLVKAYNTINYDNFSSDCEVKMEPFSIIENNKDYNKYTLRESYHDIINAESPMPLLKYLSNKLLALVDDKK